LVLMDVSDPKPAEVTEVDLAFPARGVELSPAMEDLPEPFNDENVVHPAMGLVRRLNFGPEIPGNVEFHGVKGISPEMAFRHLMVVRGCFGLKHEHKEAVMAFLISRWFTKVVVPSEGGDDEILWEQSARDAKEKD
jgi:hypothetical protein